MVRHAWLAAVLLLCAFPAFAGGEKAAPPPPKADPALLEFLGSWQGTDGQWVDPMTFASIDPSKVKEASAQRDGKPSVPPAKANPPDKSADDDGGRGT